MIKRTNRTHTTAPKPKNLVQQNTDFTAEGAPAPGKVATHAPVTPTTTTAETEQQQIKNPRLQQPHIKHDDHKHASPTKS